MTMMTADICDAFGDEVRVADAIFRQYGQQRRFHGPVCTLRVFEDNTRLRELLATAGLGRVLVVDGGGSRACALLGGNLAQMAYDNGWVGIVVNGCVRDRAEIDALALGVLALQTMPRKSRKGGRGDAEVTLRVAGIDICPGDFAYVDEDGFVVAARDLGRARAEGA